MIRAASDMTDPDRLLPYGLFWLAFIAAAVAIGVATGSGVLGAAVGLALGVLIAGVAARRRP